MDTEMSLPWFRLYRELKDDPKIGQLSDAQFRCYIESLCWACEKGDGGKMGLTIQNANWAFRRDVVDLLKSLIALNLLGQMEDGELYVPAWDKRQMKSDSSVERVRKYRGKQDETLHQPLQKRYSNGTEESRVEENREENTSVEFDEFWKLYPNKAGKPKAYQSFVKAMKSFTFEQIMEGLRRHVKCYDWTKDGGQYVPHPTTYLNQERFNDVPKPTPFNQKQASCQGANWTPTRNPNQNL